MKAEASITKEDVVASNGKIEAFCLLNGYDQVFYSQPKYGGMYSNLGEMFSFLSNQYKNIFVYLMQRFWGIPVALILSFFLVFLMQIGVENFVVPVLSLIIFGISAFSLCVFFFSCLERDLNLPMMDYDDLLDIRKVTYLKRFGINYDGNLKSQTTQILDFLHWGKLALDEESYVFKDNYEKFLMLDKGMDSKSYNWAVKDILNVQCSGISRIFREGDYIGEAVKKVMSDIDDYHERVNEQQEAEILKKRIYLKGKESSLLKNNEQRLMNIIAKKF